MRLLDAISCIVFLLLFSLFSVAQNSAEHDLKIKVSEVALLALHEGGNQSISFEASSPNSAGQKVYLAKKNSPEIWLNYSSIVKSNQKRKVTATVIGEIPSGIVLKVLASESVGGGKGKLGEPVHWASLSNSAVDVISNIGSCYTGKGMQNGHLLSYDIELDDEENMYSQLAQSETSLQIIYTLTDDN